MRWITRVAVVFFSVGFAGFAAEAQVCEGNFLGTKNLYSAPSSSALPAPKGYQPVFLNYVGRHGARHLTKSPETELAYRLVMKADSAGALTATGKQLKTMMLALAIVEKSGTKSISAEGREELKGIAQRLFAANAPVFAGKPGITVTVTKEIRTSQSADAFLSGLQPLAQNAEIKRLGINDTTLRFYDLSPTYSAFEEKGNWIKSFTALQQFQHITAVSLGIVARFFSPAFLETLTQDDKVEVASGVFGFATIVYSLQQEIKAAGFEFSALKFQSFFTCKELSALSAMDVAEDYYKKGPGINPAGIQVKIAAPLLADFLETTDAYIKNGEIKASLRFAHAETISPFATLLGLSPASKTAVDYRTIGKAWNSASIIPLSSNIQWVLYKNTAGNYLVKFLLNEKPVTVNGLKSIYPYYYSWPAVRKLYLDKLSKAGTAPGKNMPAYLRSL